MCNSDNTVRGGLTPKYKDTDTLFEMLPYHHMDQAKPTPVEGQVVASEEGSTVTQYRSGFREFRLTKVDLKPGARVALSYRSMSMLAVVQGEGRVSVRRAGEEEVAMEVESHCAYYVAPESEILVESLTHDLTLFFANSDI